MLTTAFTTKVGICLAGASLFGSFAQAQQDSMTHKMESMSKELSQGIQTSRVATIYGTISVITPALIQSGDRISGNVIMDPKGENEAKRARNLAALQGMAVTVLGMKVSNKSPSFTMVVPRNAANVVIDDSEIGLAVFAANSLPVEDNQPSFTVSCTGRTPLAIPGKFDGDSFNTKCSVGGQGSIVLAESPRLLALWVPSGLTGPQTVQVNDAGTPSDGKVNIIKLDLTTPKTNLLRGEKTFITTTVTGLQGLNASQFPIRISLVNESPENVNLAGGNTHETILQHSDVNPSGEFQSATLITATAPGSFSVSCLVTYGNNGNGIWWNNDDDRPIPMNGMDTIADLDDFSIRRLMDTLRDLRYRKMWDFVQDQKSQDWLNKKIRLVKAALRQRGVTVEDKAIDTLDE